MLRDKVHGCPWDLDQTLVSLIPHTIEEVYEVADAIEKNDIDNIVDELGDLLFQVIFYAQIGKRRKYSISKMLQTRLFANFCGVIRMCFQPVMLRALGEVRKFLLTR